MNHPYDPEQGNQLAAPMQKSVANLNGVVEIEQQRAIAETQAAMIMAKRFPRDIDEVIKKIVATCGRVGLADQAIYEYARGGTEISGPSIRLAEAIAQLWGNMQFGIRELSQQNGESTVEAFAWDVETNTRQIKVFQVAHKRHTRAGGYALKDPRDIYELVANNGARRLRACILGTIPGDVIEAAVKQCEKTILANTDLSPEGVDKLVIAFERFNVSPAMIEKRIQRKLDAITARNVLALRRVFNSLQDGIGKLEDYFDAAMIQNASATPRSEADDKKSTKKKTEPKEEQKPQVADKQEDKKPEPQAEKVEPPKEDVSTGALAPEEDRLERATIPANRNFNFED